MEKSQITVDWSKLMSAGAVGAPGENCHFVEDLAPSVEEDKTGELRLISDHELDTRILRFENTCRAVAHGLPDNGSKLKKSLALCRQEKSRRLQEKLLREKEIEIKELDKATEESADVLVIAEDGDSTGQLSAKKFSPVSASSQPPKDKNENRRGHAFESELKHYRGIKDKEMKQAYKVKSDKNISSRTSFFLSPFSLNGFDDKHRRANQNAFSIPKYPPLPLETKTATRSSAKHVAVLSPFSKGKKVETVDLSDEDEQSPCMMDVDKPLKWADDFKLYYPSEDDPEVVELSRSDLLCLEPESPLSSAIINFYIRFLKKKRPMADFYFFNTYFYQKLEEAVSCKMGDKGRVYGKIRRWWKGVNIFQKAYIFLPIHSEQHWSLVIICIPAIEDESGPIVLHLDSLGFHPSPTIFQNVDSLLKEEWSCLNQECPSPDVPIPSRIWKHLTRRIEHKVITVPKQENFYDCGLFVLYYMQRFILEAPIRFRRKYLGMTLQGCAEKYDASLKIYLEMPWESLDSKSINKSNKLWILVGQTHSTWFSEASQCLFYPQF